MGVLSILGLLKKVPIWVWLIVAAGGYIAWSQHKISSLESDITRSRLEGQGTVQIDTGLYARLALDRLAKDSLEGALAIADELNAELVAAANVTLTPDTVYRDTTIIRTEVVGDQERIAYIVDTTEVGVLDATIVAPKFPLPLRIQYAYIPAPVDFTVALLRLEDNTAIFGVSYQGQSVEIGAPYARLPAKEKKFVPYIGGFYDIGDGAFGFRGGARFKVPWISLYAFGELEQLLQKQVDSVTPLGIRVGALWEFR
jgi:hypothetical protein